MRGVFPSAAALILAWTIARAAGNPERPTVEVEQRKLHVDGKPFHLKGVNWNPVRRGGSNPEDLDYLGFVEADGELMELAGVNVVRTYDAITDPDVLDALWSRHIFVLNTVYVNANASISSAVDKVRAVVQHPAVLMWVVGNEWNFNGLYQELDIKDCRHIVKSVAELVRAEDSSRPVATVYGGLPDREMLEYFGNSVDVWGINQYEKLSFGDLFKAWSKLPTQKPMFLAEYGADAYNSLEGRADEMAQAEATRTLTEEIVGNSSQHEGGVCIGGLIFEFADELWKSGDPDFHDARGSHKTVHGAVYPDSTFNEEWWGLVAYDGSQRQAFMTFAEISSPGCPPGVLQPGCGRDPAKVPRGYRLRACGAHEACSRQLGLCCPDKAGKNHTCCTGATTTTTLTSTTTQVQKGQPPAAAAPSSRRPDRADGPHGPGSVTVRRQVHAAPAARPTSARSNASHVRWVCEEVGFYFKYAGAKAWPEEKRTYCCQHRNVGCRSEEKGDQRIEVARKFVSGRGRGRPSAPALLPEGVLLAALLASAVLVAAALGALRLRPGRPRWIRWSGSHRSLASQPALGGSDCELDPQPEGDAGSDAALDNYQDREQQALIMHIARGVQPKERCAA